MMMKRRMMMSKMSPRNITACEYVAMSDKIPKEIYTE
jgi:hypothetical protein